MLVHANDWLVLPVDLAVGGTYQLDSPIAHDVFSVDTLIQRADREPLGPGRWTLFSTSVTGQDETTADFFLLPPSAGSALQTGRVVEEARFARNEMADMAWGIEDTLETSSASRGRSTNATSPATAAPHHPRRCRSATSSRHACPATGFRCCQPRWTRRRARSRSSWPRSSPLTGTRRSCRVAGSCSQPASPRSTVSPSRRGGSPQRHPRTAGRLQKPLDRRVHQGVATWSCAAWDRRGK